MREPQIFLTGGTGILGTELIPRLLEQFPRASITALVRARGDADARRRLETLRRYLALYHPATDFGRLDVVAGDVTHPRLGIGPEVTEWLHRSVTHVVHSAATIKLSVPAPCARAVNVAGTLEALALARGCRRLKRFVHVSTAFVGGRRTGRILETELSAPRGFLNAYEASKFEAEDAVRAAMPTLPVTVVRPGILIGNAQDGHIASQATLFLPLREILRGTLRRIPGNPEATLDLLPVDVAATALARLLPLDRSVGRTYHLTGGPRNRVTIRDFLTCAMARAGSNQEPRLQFVKPLLATDGAHEESRNPFRPFFDYLDGDRVFDDAELRRDLGPMLPRRPHPRDCIDAMLRFCRDTDWGSHIPWEDESCAA